MTGEKGNPVGKSQNQETGPLVGARLLTVEETSERLNVSVWSIRRWINEGKIPRVKIGRCVRVRLDDLEAFVESGRAKLGERG